MKRSFGNYILHSFSDISLYLIIAMQNSELNKIGFSVIFYLMTILSVIVLAFNIIEYINKKNI